MKRNIENELWAKTLLSLYRYLGIMAKCIDSTVKDIGLRSAFHYNRQDSTIIDTNKIMLLSERKIKIINLKIIVEKCLTLLKESDMKILTLILIDGLSFTKAIQVLNMPPRTFYRNKEMAMRRFAKKLESLGYTAEYLENYLEGESWIKNTHNKVCEMSKNEINYDGLKLTTGQIKFLMSQFNRECICNQFSYF